MNRLAQEKFIGTYIGKPFLEYLKASNFFN